jgi:hypothetical protein
MATSPQPAAQSARPPRRLGTNSKASSKNNSPASDARPARIGVLSPTGQDGGGP